MSTFFVITFGTSDVQFEQTAISDSGFELRFKKVKGFESIMLKPKRSRRFAINLKKNRSHNSFLLVSPRNDGQAVLKNFASLSSLISLPLTLPAIRKIIAEGEQIHKFLLVYTDQFDANERHRSNDSINIASIFKKQILALYPELDASNIIDVPITEKVTDIDHQYVMFSKACRTILQTPHDQIKKIILLAQGGIDQINQALTLQLIQAFGNKLQIYQQAEDKEPHPLNFTHLFLHDFIKHQVIALINAADYHAALMMMNMFENERFRAVKPFVEFAGFRKLFLYKEAEKVAGLLAKDKSSFMVDYSKKENMPNHVMSGFNNKDNLFLIAERFYLADFYFSRADYTDFVLALQIFFETLCNLYLSDLYNVDLTKKHHESVTRLLNNIRENENDLYKTLIEKLNFGETSLMVSFPTIAVLAFEVAKKNSHYQILIILEPILHINSQLNGYSGSCGLDILRNMIAHGGKGVLENDLFLASNIKYKYDRLKYWKEMMNEIRNNFFPGNNPYDEMNKFLAGKLTITY